MNFDGMDRSGFDITGLSRESVSICEEWCIARNKLPFFGEKMDSSAFVRFWNSIAGEYGKGERSELTSSVLGTLREMDLLDGSILDVGSGPGTYSLPFAKTAEKVVALDSSEMMLNNLLKKKSELSLSNVSHILVDWNEYVPERKFDLVFSSLCPGANSPASILRMEASSKGKCAYVSSMNKDENINFEIWRKLGREYSAHGYNTRYPYKFLKSIGRKPFFSKMSWTRSTEIDTAELIERLVRSFSMYKNLDQDEVKATITDVVHEKYGTGKTVEETRVRAGLLVWDSPTGDSKHR